MKKHLGIITIGQSPRTDVVPEIVAHLDSHVNVIERGVLDGLTDDEIQAFSHQKGMLPLVSRLSNGNEVVVAKEKLLPRLEVLVSDLDREGMDMILLLCNGDFPDFATRCLVVEPQRIVDHCLSALLRPDHHLGVMVPVSEQVTWVRERLESAHHRLTIATASPYQNTQALVKACEKFNDARCDLIVLYCMGFNKRFGTQVRELCNQPVIVSITIVARTLGELMASK